MKRIALIPCPVKDPESIWATKAAEILIQSGAEVLFPFGMLPEIQGAIPMFAESIYDECDCVVAFGGDGSLIAQALKAAQYGKALLGCNMGKVGYLAELELNELAMLPRLLANDFAIEERMVLAVTDHRGFIMP